MRSDPQEKEELDLVIKFVDQRGKLKTNVFVLLNNKFNRRPHFDEDSIL
jgi:hypothetical protein